MEKLGILAILFTILGISTSPHPFLLVLCYIIHELGHISFAKMVGARTKKIKILAFRLSIGYDQSGLTYPQEILVCLGGIIFNLASAGIVWLLPFFSGEASLFFVVCNLSLALMNLYPVAILDGGGILRAVLLWRLGEDKAEKISRGVSLICAILLWLLSVYLQLAFSSNLSLLVISIVLLVQLCFSL
ncbi:MAG: site-2 protease family protein [Clostridia bacterium]|nr:site-2 protease family protein [Clostridia bacterium]